MAKGNRIIVTADPKGVILDGIVSGTPKPGTMMELKAATEPVGGRYTYQAYQPGTDGNRRPVIILLEQDLLGSPTATGTYADGDRAKFYCPLPGEEMNVLLKNIGGTATGSGDSFAIGDLLIADTGTGKFIATTGSPESEPFQVLETVAEITADTLCHVMATGY